MLAISGVDGEFLARLRPFVVVSDAERQRPGDGAARLAGLAGRVVWRAESGALARGSRFAETAEIRRGAGVRFGATTERDPGERGAFDYRAAWLDARRGRARLLAGAFDVDWGLGLTLSTARAPWTGDAIARRALRDGRGLSPHRGAGEEGHLAGAAGWWGGARGAVAWLYSDARRDALRDSDGRVTSLPETGLHRTARERSARDRLRERTVAIRAEAALPAGVRLGVTGRADAFDPRLAPRSGSSVPAGAREQVFGADGRAGWGPVRLAVERAAVAGGASARVVALEAAGHRARIAAVDRRFEPGFRVLRTAPLGHFGRSANESGRLVSVEWRARRLRVTADFDRWNEIIARSANGETERGTETVLSAESTHEGKRIAARVSRRTRRTEVRDAARVEVERPIGRGLAARVRVDAIAESESVGGQTRVVRGHLAQSRLALAGRAGLRSAVTLSVFGGDSAGAVPRIAEAFLPGVVRPVALASGPRTAGWRALVTTQRAFGRALRLAAAFALHAPRGGAARAEIGLAIELGRAARGESVDSEPR